MLFLFRLCRILINATRSRTTLDAFGQSVVRFRVMPGDCVIRAMGNDKYHAFMNLGRMDLAMRRGWIRSIIRKKWRPAIIAVHILHRQELTCFQRFELRTRVVFFDKHFIWMEQIFECKGVMAAIAMSKLTATDNQGIVPVASKLGLSDNSPTHPIAQRVTRVLNEVGAIIRYFSRVKNSRAAAKSST